MFKVIAYIWRLLLFKNTLQYSNLFWKCFMISLSEEIYTLQVSIEGNILVDKNKLHILWKQFRLVEQSCFLNENSRLYLDRFINALKVLLTALTNSLRPRRHAVPGAFRYLAPFYFLRLLIPARVPFKPTQRRLAYWWHMICERWRLHLWLNPALMYGGQSLKVEGDYVWWRESGEGEFNLRWDLRMKGMRRDLSAWGER